MGEGWACFPYKKSLLAHKRGTNLDTEKYPKSLEFVYILVFKFSRFEALFLGFHSSVHSLLCIAAY